MFLIALDPSVCMPEGEALLGRQSNQFLYPLAEECIISDEGKQRIAEYQTHSQRQSDAPSSGPQRLLRYCVHMPGRENHDRTGQSPKSTVRHFGSGGSSDQKAQAPLRDAIGLAQTCRQTLGFDPRSS